MKTTLKIASLFALLVASSISFAAPTESEIAAKEEAVSLKAEIASQELILKSLKYRLGTLQAKNTIAISITIKEKHYLVDDKLAPLVDSTKDEKKALDILSDVIKKQCLLKKANAVEIHASKLASYSSVQDAIEACQAAGIMNISLSHINKEG